MKTLWKAMMEFPLIIEVKMKVLVSLGDFLNKNLPRKREYHSCLIKKASTLRCSEKQVLLQRIKAAINRCSVKKCFKQA